VKQQFRISAILENTGELLLLPRAGWDGCLRAQLFDADPVSHGDRSHTGLFGSIEITLYGLIEKVVEDNG
jgi:hypothetical protein